jgi:hypothetical protein
MGFKAAFTMNDVKAHMNKAKQGFEDSLLDEFRRTGEQFIADARSIRTYQDQTGNLRGSIGYCLFKDGQLVESSFPGGDITGSGSTLANEVSRSYPKGVLLVVVAGMFYAQYVEAKSYDVLTGSSYAAEANIKARVKKLFDMLNRKT